MPMIENFDVISGELIEQFEVTEEEYRLYRQINSIPGSIDDIKEWIDSIRNRKIFDDYERAMQII